MPAVVATVGVLALQGDVREHVRLLEELGVAAVHAHDLALADRFTQGLARLGHEPLPAPGSAIVSVPGLGAKQAELSRAGIQVKTP